MTFDLEAQAGIHLHQIANTIDEWDRLRRECGATRVEVQGEGKNCSTFT
jgi:hypothetical protein